MLYVLDRAQAALCVLSNYYDDTHEIDIEAGVSSYQFTITKKESGAEFLQTGNYIVMQDDLGVNMVFTILKTTEVHETIQVYTIDAGIELFNKMMAEWTETEAHPIAYYIEKCLKNTPWKIGVNEISSLSRKISYEGKDTGLSRILSLLNSFDKAEINFSLKLKGLTITDWNINIYKQLGSNRTDVQVVYSRELNDITKEESREVFVTALQGIGASIEVEEGKPEKHTDFTDEDYDDGDFVSPMGDSWLYARTANEQFNPTKAYIEDYFEYDTSSPSELLNRTITQIKERSIPSITYNADISIIDPTLKIGDYITIIDHDYRPALYLRGRVLKMTKSYTDPSKNKVTMGNYQVLQSNIDDRLKDLQEQIKSIPAGKTLYTWIRYASDDKGANMTSTPTANTKYVAIISNKPTGVPSDKSADYAGHWQLIQGQDGSDGIPGPKGEDGKTSYTHFAYADNVSGTEDFSTDDPTGRSYMGVYSDFTKADSTNPSDYVWSYTKGEAGPVGRDGAQGIPGKPGADGKTPYTHVAYADNDEGGGFSQSPDNKAYMGWYSDFTQADSTDPSLYGWSLIKGDNGETPYVHTAWSRSLDGKDRFTTVYPNLNLLVNSSAKTKDGFFKNFDKVENDYGEVTLKGTNTYNGRDLSDGFTMQPRDYKPNDKYTISMDVMFTSWNLPAGTTLTEFWLGQRYLAPTWKQISVIDLPKDPSQMLNQWIRITQTSTIPPYADPSINAQAIFQARFVGASEGSFTFRVRKPKQEFGSIATPWMPSSSEVTTADWPSYRGEYTDYTEADSDDPTKYKWALVKGRDGKNGTDGTSPINLVINSSNGYQFKNSIINTIFTAILYQDNKEIDSDGTKFAYIWTKTNPDGTADTAWNLAHQTSQKSITITNSDVLRRATFDCTAESLN